MICLICGQEFTPSKYRPGQKVCSATDCQQKRQLANTRDWLKRNPEYYRYSQSDPSWKERHSRRTKIWREKHLDWIKQYQEGHRAYRRLYMKEYMRQYRAGKKEGQ